MKRLSLLFALIILMFGIAFQQQMVAGEDWCLYDQFYSPGNPYYCSICSLNDANCTWWAWRSMNENWILSPTRSWGNARNWVNSARADHYGISASPAVGTVGVNPGAGLYGHVAWVLPTWIVRVFGLRK